MNIIISEELEKETIKAAALMETDVNQFIIDAIKQSNKTAHNVEELVDLISKSNIE
jgi:uncharacterized protein (DUF1778 family)